MHIMPQAHKTGPFTPEKDIAQAMYPVHLLVIPMYIWGTYYSAPIWFRPYMIQVSLGSFQNI
jgi:hypothetical protein